MCALLVTNDAEVVITQRSDKVDHPGKWALPCGYIDWNESIHQALVREIWEELGLNISGYPVFLYDINDDPNKDERQNVTFHFAVSIRNNCIILRKPLDSNVRFQNECGQRNSISRL